MKFINNRKFYNIAVIFILATFLIFGVYTAINIKEGIIPDEGVHAAYISKFSRTWGIPSDDSDTYQYGVYIKNRPFLYYWLGGRLDSIFALITRDSTTAELLIFHRIVNSLLSTATILFTYLISKRIIKNVWFQLLPPFMLANTLMYALLAGGVNYDNLTNLLCVAAIYYYIRMIQEEFPIKIILAWISLISLASLTKVAALPIAGMMFLIAVIILIQQRVKGNNIIKGWKSAIPLIIFTISTLLLAGIFYVNNIIRYQSVDPKCEDLYSTSVCELSAFVKRNNSIQLPDKLTIKEAIELGKYEPVQYIFYSWIPHIADKIFGFHGHKNYFPYAAGFFPILFLWIILMSVRWTKDWGTVHTVLAVFVVSLTLTILFWNYNSELKFGFIHVAVQGRYLFPIIGTFYVLLIYGLESIKPKLIMVPTLAILLILFLYCGPLRLFVSPEKFIGWFN